MAISIPQVQAITHDAILKVLGDVVFESAPAFRRFYAKRKKLGGGNDVGAPVISAAIDDTSGGWYSGAANLTDAEVDDITRAKVDWKQAYETILLSHLDIMKNGNDQTAVLNLLSSKIKIGKKRFISRLSSGIFSDGTTNTLAFNGLQQIIGTGAYAGLSASDILDESGANAWQAQILANSGTPRALAGNLIQQAMGLATEDDDKPTVAYQKQNVFDELWSILEPHQRLMSEDESLSGLGHDQNKKVLKYNGIPFLVDSHMKAGSMFFINEEYCQMFVHSMEDMKAQSFKQLEDQNAVKERMLLTGNMLCYVRNRQAELADISVAS